MALIGVRVGVTSANRINLVAAFLLLLRAFRRAVLAFFEIHFGDRPSRLSAIEHLHLAFISVNVVVGTADRHFRHLLAIQGTSHRPRRSLPRDAKRHRHFEYVLSAILGAHFAGVGIEDAIAAASWFGSSPAHLSTVPRRLAVLLIRPHHALTASENLHETSRLVDVSVAAANGPVEWGLFAVNGTVFPVGRNVVAGPEVRELDAHPANLYP